jgi:hypothetical protein
MCIRNVVFNSNCCPSASHAAEVQSLPHLVAVVGSSPLGQPTRQQSALQSITIPTKGSRPAHHHHQDDR